MQTEDLLIEYSNNNSKKPSASLITDIPNQNDKSNNPTPKSNEPSALYSSRSAVSSKLCDVVFIEPEAGSPAAEALAGIAHNPCFK